MARIGEFDVRSDPDCDKLSRTGCFPSVQDLAVEDVTVHKGWDRVFVNGNDIALVRLKEEITFATVSFLIFGLLSTMGNSVVVA